MGSQEKTNAVDPVSLAFISLAAWRENRNHGIPGLQSVCNVIINRMAAWQESGYQVVTTHEQFSSMTAPGDPQLGLYPAVADPQWREAQVLAREGLAGTLPDITGGATNYYALGEEEPRWAVGMQPTVIIGSQQFLKP
jgi:spore germination cell wall hydrolase CwlJ-like protein